MIIRGKWAGAVLAVLILSLGLNLFITGFAVSRIYQFRHGHGPGIERVFSAYLARFPREIRRGIRDEMGVRRSDFKAAMESLHKARTSLIDAMRTNPLDRSALTRAMNDVGEQLAVAQKLGQEAVQRAIENANPEARARIEPWRPRWRRSWD